MSVVADGLEIPGCAPHRIVVRFGPESSALPVPVLSV